MDSNHRFLVVGQESSPLDHGTVRDANREERVESRKEKIRKRLTLTNCSTLLGLLSTLYFLASSAEAVGLEPTNGFHPPPVFRTGSSSGRMTSSSCGSWNRTNDLLGQSQALLPAATTPQCCQKADSQFGKRFGEEDSNLRRLVQRQAAYH